MKSWTNVILRNGNLDTDILLHFCEKLQNLDIMQTIYERLGAENLDLLVENFYDLVMQSEKIAPLFKTDIKEVKRKQFMFLTQFFGGPALYAAEFGHPRMRMRHMPHKIDEEAAIEWLLCMKGAIMKLPIEQEFQNEIFQRFPKVAAHMMNS